MQATEITLELFARSEAGLFIAARAPSGLRYRWKDTQPIITSIGLAIRAQAAIAMNVKRQRLPSQVGDVHEVHSTLEKLPLGFATAPELVKALCIDKPPWVLALARRDRAGVLITSTWWRGDWRCCMGLAALFSHLTSGSLINRAAGGKGWTADGPDATRQAPEVEHYVARMLGPITGPPTIDFCGQTAIALLFAALGDNDAIGRPFGELDRSGDAKD